MYSKKSSKSITSLFFSKKNTDKTTKDYELVIKEPELQTKTKSRLKLADFELLNKYLFEESIMTTTDSIKNIIKLVEVHEKRLKSEEGAIIDIENTSIEHNNIPILVIIKGWAKLVKTSIENLDETIQVLCTENFEPVACFHLNRSIIHLLNLYETFIYMSKEPHELLDIITYNYLNIITGCIRDFKIEFNKFCKEITQYITDFKTTLTLLINHRPENRLVISAMGDVEKLYNCSIDLINKTITSTPDGIDLSFNIISMISNDINDIKSDLINIKHHQDKDIKYVHSSYV
jgi:hypothetical protein